MVPVGISFGTSAEYEDRCRSFDLVLEALPLIDGWKPTGTPMHLDDIAQSRLDALEIGEIEAQVSVENAIEAPGPELNEYRFRLNNKRRALIRDNLVELIDLIDGDIHRLRGQAEGHKSYEKIGEDNWNELRSHVKQIDVLLGSSVAKPDRWGELYRHMSFAMIGDLDDIERMDWPAAKASLRKGLYGVNEPIPSPVADLGDIVSARPTGKIVTRLNWAALDASGFEGLLFALISDEPSFENPNWLTATNAPDQGRDLEATLVSELPLVGTRRSRVIVQCKHWQSASIGVDEVSKLKAQMEFWTSPPVDVLIIATSGRFTNDAIQLIEKHNAERKSPTIHMWPESHLERLLERRALKRNRGGIPLCGEL